MAKGATDKGSDARALRARFRPVAERNYGLPSLDPRPFSAPRPPPAARRLPAPPPPRLAAPRLSGFRGDRPLPPPAGAPAGYSASPASEEAGRPGEGPGRRAGRRGGLGKISEKTP